MDRLGRFPVRTGSARDDAVAQLRWAMGGAGLSAEKLLRMPDVLALPAVAAALAATPAPDVPRAAYDVVAAALRGMGDGLRARLLRAALAVDYAGDGTDLTSRRTEFERLSGRTQRSLYAYEQVMLEEIVTRLGAPPPELAPGDRPPAPPPSELLAAGAWVFERRTLLFRMRGRAGRVAELSDVFRATEPGLTDYWLWYFCATSPTRAAKVQMRWGGHITDDRPDGQPGVRRVTVGLPRPLQAGETHTVAYEVRYPARREGDGWCTMRVFRPTGALEVRVAFDPEAIPRRVWLLDAVPPMSGPGDPDSCPPLEVGGHGFVEASFDRPRVPLGYGVAWEW